MKRITTMLIAIAMICALSGCGSNTATSTTGSDVNTSASDTVTDAVTNDTSTSSDNVDTNASIDNTTDASVTTTDTTVDTTPVEPEITCVLPPDSAFDYCDIATAKEYAFVDPDTFDLYSEADNNSIVIMGYGIAGTTGGDAVHIIMPAKIAGEPVVAAFGGSNWSDKLITVEFQNGYTKLPMYILQAAKKLETVIIPDTVIEIEDDVCLNCDELVNVNIPDNIQFLGEYAFYGCKKIEATYRGNIYTYDMLPQLRADIIANNPDLYDNGTYVNADTLVHYTG